MVSIFPLISNYSSLLSKPLLTVPSILITIINVTFMFFSFYIFQARSKYLSTFSLSFIFTLWSTGRTKSAKWPFLLFLLTITRSSLLTRIVRSVCISKSQIILWVPFTRTDSGLYVYYLLVWTNVNLLYNFKWITFPTLSCRVLYFFGTCWLHSLIMWLNILSLSLHEPSRMRL